MIWSVGKQFAQQGGMGREVHSCVCIYMCVCGVRVRGGGGVVVVVVKFSR